MPTSETHLEDEQVCRDESQRGEENKKTTVYTPSITSAEAFFCGPQTPSNWNFPTLPPVPSPSPSHHNSPSQSAKGGGEEASSTWQDVEPTQIVNTPPFLSSSAYPYQTSKSGIYFPSPSLETPNTIPILSLSKHDHCDSWNSTVFPPHVYSSSRSATIMDQSISSIDIIPPFTPGSLPPTGMIRSRTNSKVQKILGTDTFEPPEIPPPIPPLSGVNTIIPSHSFIPQNNHHNHNQSKSKFRNLIVIVPCLIAIPPLLAMLQLVTGHGILAPVQSSADNVNVSQFANIPLRQSAIIGLLGGIVFSTGSVVLLGVGIGIRFLLFGQFQSWNVKSPFRVSSKAHPRRTTEAEESSPQDFSFFEDNSSHGHGHGLAALSDIIQLGNINIIKKPTINIIPDSPNTVWSRWKYPVTTTFIIMGFILIGTISGPLGVTMYSTTENSRTVPSLNDTCLAGFVGSLVLLGSGVGCVVFVYVLRFLVVRWWKMGRGVNTSHV